MFVKVLITNNSVHFAVTLLVIFIILRLVRGRGVEGHPLLPMALSLEHWLYVLCCISQMQREANEKQDNESAEVMQNIRNFERAMILEILMHSLWPT